jgi:hypothetical protein
MLLRRLMIFLDTLTADAPEERISRLADLFAPLLFRKKKQSVESLDPSENTNKPALSSSLSLAGLQANLKQERRVISELTRLFIVHHFDLLGVCHRFGSDCYVCNRLTLACRLCCQSRTET